MLILEFDVRFGVRTPLLLLRAPVGSLHNSEMGRLSRWLVRAAAVPLTAAAITGTDSAAAKTVNFELHPAPALIAFAEKNEIPHSGIAVPDPRVAPGPGDRMTFVLYLIDKSGQRQWLIDLSRVALSEAEKAAPAPKPLTIYSSIGASYIIPSTWAAEAVRIAGPFWGSGSKSSQNEWTDRNARFLVHDAYLSLGLDRTAAFYISKLQPAAKAVKDWRRYGSIRYRPFPEGEIKAAQAAAKAINVTSDEDAANSKVLPAMEEFFRIAEQTPGIREIVLSILASPSLSSVILRGGRFDLNFDLMALQTKQVSDPDSTRFMPTPVYSFPFEFQINRQAALDCVMTVTEPRAPLSASAGIILLMAQQPNQYKVMVLALLSASCSR